MSKWLPELLIAVIILAVAGVITLFLYDPDNRSAIVQLIYMIHNEFIDSSVAT